VDNKHQEGHKVAPPLRSQPRAHGDPHLLWPGNVRDPWKFRDFWAAPRSTALRARGIAHSSNEPEGLKEKPVPRKDLWRHCPGAPCPRHKFRKYSGVSPATPVCGTGIRRQSLTAGLCAGMMSPHRDTGRSLRVPLHHHHKVAVDVRS
jgi:hypothetical protein